MRSRDVVAYIILFGVAIFLLLFVGYVWVQNIGWRYLWLLSVLEMGLVVMIGYLFARYAISPILEQNQQLDRMLQDTLHELNIPVATIQANASMLKKICKDERAQKKIARIEAASHQLLELYQDVEYTIKEEISKESKEEFDVSELIKQRLELFEELLQQKRLSLQLQPLMVRLPKRGFVKVFDNLLSNAIKYSGKDALIQIIVQDSALVIKDSGVGIDEQELLKIFDRYYRAENSQQGFGIGLSIVKSFCDKEQIPIAISSQKGKGTTIRLDLRKVKV